MLRLVIFHGDFMVFYGDTGDISMMFYDVLWDFLKDLMGFNEM